jgi:hypothetical protein
MSPDAYKAWLASRKVKFIFRTLENCWNRVFVFVFYFCVCFKHSKIVVTKPWFSFLFLGLFRTLENCLNQVCVFCILFLCLFVLCFCLCFELSNFFWTYCLFSFWTAIFYLSVCYGSYSLLWRFFSFFLCLFLLCFFLPFLLKFDIFVSISLLMDPSFVCLLFDLKSVETHWHEFMCITS